MKFLLIPIFLLMLDFIISDDVQNYQLPVFNTKDLQGNDISRKIFDGKFSVVCLWTTNDYENSRELLEFLSSIEDDSIQIVGIIGDVKDTDDISKAVEISNSFNIQQLLVNDEMIELLQKIRVTPTTFFIDYNGNVIGQPVSGNEPTLIKKEIDRLMKKDPTVELSKYIQNKLFH